ncbi:MAG: hypothetical protein ACE5G0_18820, partial [Rhodothermales bacterium]
MEHRKPVIKKFDIAALLPRIESEPSNRPHPLRIKRRQVTTQSGPTDDLGEEFFKLQGVLRGSQAQAASVPYEVATPEFKADFPLRQEQRAVLEERARAAEAEQPTPEEQLEALEAQWQKRLEEEVERARIEAHAEGYSAARAEMEAEFEEKKAAVVGDMARFQEGWKDFMKKSEQLLATIAFDIVRQLLDAPLPQDVKAVSTQALAQAIEQFGEQSQVEITLNPEDYTRLEAYGIV